MNAPHDLFGRVAAAPSIADRRQRLQWLLEVADALVEGRTPSRPAALFVGAALAEWLRNPGDLEREFFRVRAPSGSHYTRAMLVASILAHPDDE